ncbi:hypothetical protein [Lactococcus piscium]
MIQKRVCHAKEGITIDIYLHITEKLRRLKGILKGPLSLLFLIDKKLPTFRPPKLAH